MDGNQGIKLIQAEGHPALATFAGLDGTGVLVALVVSANSAHVSWSNDLTKSEIRLYVNGSELSVTGKAIADFTQQTLVVPQADTKAAVMSAVLATTQASSTKFRQTTFIPDASLPAPQGICTPWRDDSSDTAPNTSMTMTVKSKNSKSVTISLQQDVTNPLCDKNQTNGIFSDTDVTISITGTTAGSISYLAMPNYELYTRQDSGAYSTVAQFNYMHLACLFKPSGIAGLVCRQNPSF